jgi:hypothetical protein
LVSKYLSLNKENLTIDIAEIKLNKNLNLKHNGILKADKALLYEVKHNFVSSGILEISRIESLIKKKVDCIRSKF